MVTFPLSLHEAQGNFFWEPCGTPGSKIQGSVPHPLPRVLNLKLVPTEPPAVHGSQVKHPISTGPICGLWSWISAPDKMWFSAPTYLSSTQGNSLPCGLNSLLDLRRIDDFKFIQLFLIVRMAVTTSKPLICPIRNRKSINFLCLTQEPNSVAHSIGYCAPIATLIWKQFNWTQTCLKISV